jgi:hypothetical protein
VKIPVRAAAIMASVMLAIGLAGCQPACTASAQLALILEGQRDVNRCPDQRFDQTIEQQEPFRQCVQNAVAAGRAFAAAVRVGRPERDSATPSRFLIGRTNRGEFEVFLFYDVNSNSPGARVIGSRCDGFSSIRCDLDLNGVSCEPVCRALVNEPPRPPYAAHPALDSVWCGPPF